MARRRDSIQSKKTAPLHISWKTIRTYKGLYRSGKGDEITIRSVVRPPKAKVFRTAAGRRKYKLVQLKSTLREVIIVASTKSRKKAVDQEELEELEALEDLEELEEDEEIEDEVEDDEEEDEDEEDEEEPEDEEDEDDEEEEEAPRRARKTKAKKAAPKKTKSRASADGMVGTQEVAEHFGVEPRALRVLLRKNDIETDPDSGRYQWKSLNSPAVVKIGKLIKSGAHKAAQKEQFDKLRAKKTNSKTAAKKTTAKKTTATKTRRRRRASEEDED